MTTEQGYSGKGYWEEYHDSGLSKKLDRERKQEKWLRPFIPILQEHQARTIHDLGCGSGYDALALAQTGFTVSGTDISSIAIDHAIAQAKEAGLDIDYRQHDIALPLPFPDSQFDAVVCNLTLHMFPVETARNIAREVQRCLVPGGLFLLHVNSTDDLPYRRLLQPPVVELGEEMYCFGRGQTMRFFSETACRELLEGWQFLNLEAVQMLRANGEVQKCAWRVVARAPAST